MNFVFSFSFKKRMQLDYKSVICLFSGKLRVFKLKSNRCQVRVDAAAAAGGAL